MQYTQFLNLINAVDVFKSYIFYILRHTLMLLLMVVVMMYVVNVMHMVTPLLVRHAVHHRVFQR